MLEKIALGTAQMQGPYGVINNSQILNINEIKKIIRLLRENKILTIDTAQNYGNAEKQLGTTNLQDFKIITKLNFDLQDVRFEKEIIDKVRLSLKNLRINKIYAVLIHNPKIVLHSKFYKVVNILQKLQKDGYLDKIGYSVYSPLEVEKYFQIFKPDIIQYPYNIFDRRFETTGWISKFKKENIESHSRSIFLQGLLLVNSSDLNKKYFKWKRFFEKWHAWLRNNKISARQAAINFVFSNADIDKIILGVKNSDQFVEIIENINNISNLYPLDFFSEDEELINPINWNSL